MYLGTEVRYMNKYSLDLKLPRPLNTNNDLIAFGEYFCCLPLFIYHLQYVYSKQVWYI